MGFAKINLNTKTSLNLKTKTDGNQNIQIVTQDNDKYKCKLGDGNLLKLQKSAKRNIKVKEKHTSKGETQK